ncbi:sugar ABC transporter permease [soil metagenome]
MMLERRERRGLALMLLPYLLGITILIAGPALITFALSVYKYDLLRPAEFIGLDNFRELAGDNIFLTSVRNSLLYIAFAVPLRLVGAVCLALLLHKRFRGVSAYRTSAYLPTVVPDVAYALLWLWIFNPLFGPMNLFLEAVGIGGPAWLTSPTAARSAIVIMGLFTIGEGFIVAMATRQDIPGELYELAEIEGTGPLAAFRRITLPIMAPTLLLLLFRDTVFSFQANFVPALLVTGGGPPPYATTYLPLFIYRQGFEYLRYGYAAAATLAMFLITAVIVYVQYRIVKRWRHAFVV